MYILWQNLLSFFPSDIWLVIEFLLVSNVVEGLYLQSEVGEGWLTTFPSVALPLLYVVPMVEEHFSEYHGEWPFCGHRKGVVVSWIDQIIFYRFNRGRKFNRLGRRNKVNSLEPSKDVHQLNRGDMVWLFELRTNEWGRGL